MAASIDSSDIQVRVAELGGRFTPEARKRIEDYLHSFVSFEPTLGLLYSAASGSGSWSLTAYSQSMVEELARMYGKFGAVVCYDLDNIRVVVPQLAHIDELDGGTLDFIGDRLRRRVPDAS